MAKNVWVVYFSPADGTRKVVIFVAKQIANAFGVRVREIDFTRKETRTCTYEFSESDIVIFGSPVYAGRIPNKIMPDWKRCFAGNGAAAVAVCTFGNRSFDGALDELHLILQQSGFRIVAKAAVVCQHVFSEKVGTGRPDAADQEALRSFADNIAVRWMNELRASSDHGIGKAAGEQAERKVALWLSEDTIIGPYYTPLKTDGTPARFLKAKPLTNENCTDCRICIGVCPMGSIDANDSRVVSGICIKCQACILKCPAHAKYFADEEFLSHVKMLEENDTSRRDSVFILPEI